MILINLIYLFNIILLLYFIKNIIIMLFKRTTDIYSFKIFNKFLSAIIIIIYIFVVILGLYFYRLYTLGKSIDLKGFINTLNIFDVPLLHKYYLILQATLLLLLLCLFFVMVHKMAKKEIYKIYIFINYKLFLRTNKYTKNIYVYLKNIGNYNLISFILQQISNHLTLFFKDLEISYGATYKRYEYPEYSFVNIIHHITHHRFFKTKIIYTFDIVLYYIMPLLFIAYDCLIHNFVLIHIFYYLPFIILIKLLQSITIPMGCLDSSLSDLIWEIYYKKERCIYACTKEQKILLDTYILNGLRMLPGLDMVFLSEQLNVLNNSPLHFKLVDEKHKLYQNDFGEYIQEQDNGDFLFVIDYLLDDENPFILYGEKMILLADKR